jgi:hypothetical protein
MHCSFPPNASKGHLFAQRLRGVELLSIGIGLSKISEPPARGHDPGREFLRECTCQATWEQLALKAQ